MARYTLKGLEGRIEAMKEASNLILSVQYGMVFILNEHGEILLRCDELVDEDERKKV